MREKLPAVIIASGEVALGLLRFVSACLLALVFSSGLVLAQGELDVPADSGKALALIQEGKYEQAADELKQLLEAQPSNPELISLLGVTQFKLGDIKAASVLFTESLGIAPNYVPALVNAAICHYQLGELSEAGKLLQEAVFYEPDNKDVHLHLAILKIKLGDAETALQELETAEALGAGGAEVSYAKGLALLALGDPARAYNAFQQASLKDEQPKYLLGIMLTTQDQSLSEKMLAQLIEGIVAKPEDISQQQALVKIISLRKLRLSDEQLNTLKALLEGDSVPQKGYLLRCALAANYLNGDDLDAAEAELSKAKASAANDIEVLRLLITLYLRKQEWQQAKDLLPQAISLAQDDETLHHAYAITLWALAKYDEYAKELEVMLALNPENDSARLSLAEYLASQGQWSSALKHYQLLLPRTNDPDVLYRIGRCQLANYLWSEAQKTFSRALTLAPDDAKLLSATALAYEGEGELKLAGEYYQQALQKQPELQEAKQGLDRISASKAASVASNPTASPESGIQQ